MFCRSHLLSERMSSQCESLLPFGLSLRSVRFIDSNSGSLEPRGGKTCNTWQRSHGISPVVFLSFFFGLHPEVIVIKISMLLNGHKVSGGFWLLTFLALTLPLSVSYGHEEDQACCFRNGEIYICHRLLQHSQFHTRSQFHTLVTFVFDNSNLFIIQRNDLVYLLTLLH